MQLALEHVSKKVGAEQWLYELRLAPRSGEVTVLLGATQAGKASLMRIMAGLHVPAKGRAQVTTPTSPVFRCASPQFHCYEGFHHESHEGFHHESSCF